VKSQIEIAIERFNAAPRELAAATFHAPARDELTREQLLELIDVAIAAGFCAGYTQAESDATNERILSLMDQLHS
jgi:hypothetical protein